jgi:hypothetical protein
MYNRAAFVDCAAALAASAMETGCTTLLTSDSHPGTVDAMTLRSMSPDHSPRTGGIAS